MSYFLFVVVLAFLFAKVEIQIEGGEGWAKNLPTWRIENHWALKIFWGGRALTGYHFWVMSFIFVLFHSPYFFIDWTLKHEMKVLGAIILFWIIEDFIWFVINPKFGMRKFRKKFIPWHPRWFLGAPVDYWFFLPVGIGLLWYSSSP